MLEHFVIGLGEIGRPLQEILGCQGWDAKDGSMVAPAVRFLHICFPYSETFAGDVVDYIYRNAARAAVVHSTVLPGTTRTIQRLLIQSDAPSSCGVVYSPASCGVVYSPVRGRHGDMERDMRYFTKFVASPSRKAAAQVAAGLSEHGFRVKVHPDPTSLELSKLFQTTATAVQVAFAQEMDRYCKELGVDFLESQALLDMPNLPDVIHQPGFIGGHCLMQNLNLLDAIRRSAMTNWLCFSNDTRAENHGREEERLYPIPWRQYV